jgi:hypothetical protein
MRDRLTQLENWYDGLAEFALGWLYWSEEQVLHSDVNAILLAQRGHLEMLKTIHGSSEPTLAPWQVKRQAEQDASKVKLLPVTAGGKPTPMTPAAFDAMFGSKHTRSPVRIRR